MPGVAIALSNKTRKNTPKTLYLDNNTSGKLSAFSMLKYGIYGDINVGDRLTETKYTVTQIHRTTATVS